MTLETTTEKICLIYITTADRGEAVNIGRNLVSRRLAACANVITPTTAIYRWEDEVCEGEEATLIVKTTQSRIDEVSATVRALHSYELPCIIALNDVVAKTH